MSWHFNWVDIVIIVIVGRAGYIGSQRGMGVCLTRLVVIVLALLLAALAAGPSSRAVSAWLPVALDRLEQCTFVVLALTAWVALGFLSRLWLRMLNQDAIVPWRQVVGSVLGAVTGCVLAGAIMWALVFLPSRYVRESIAERSFTGRRLLTSVRTVVKSGVRLVGLTPSSALFGRTR